MTTSTADLIARFRAMIDHTPACSTDPYRAYDDHDLADNDTRDILIASDDPSEIAHFLRNDATSTDAPAIAQIILELTNRAKTNNSSAREYITDLALSHSLCPLHLIDYAICFDDIDPECAQIRIIHPSHDT